MNSLTSAFVNLIQSLPFNLSQSLSFKFTQSSTVKCIHFSASFNFFPVFVCQPFLLFSGVSRGFIKFVEERVVSRGGCRLLVFCVSATETDQETQDRYKIKKVGKDKSIFHPMFPLAFASYVSIHLLRKWLGWHRDKPSRVVMPNSITADIRVADCQEKIKQRKCA